MSRLVIVALFAAVVWLGIAALVALPLKDRCYCGDPECDCVGFDDEDGEM